MRTIGVFLNRDLKRNAGGPSGYLYNLSQGLDAIPNNIKFFTRESVRQPDIKGNDSKQKKFNPVFADFRLAVSFLFKGIKLKGKLDLTLYEMDFVHVHSSEDLFSLKFILRYKGNVVFTPHRPEPLSNEVITTQKLLNNTDYSYPILRKVCDFIERYSYKKANAFIFPSFHARQIYMNFPGFKQYAEDKPTRYVYTGTRDVNVTANAEEYKEKCLEDGQTFAFVGRHNYIKGYDLLVNTFPYLQRKGCKVLCAGAVSNIKPPMSSEWTELGYIEDANSLMKAVDCVVIPNRNTYFDLIIVEALAVGAIIITSDTGGNIDIAKETNGIILFESGNLNSLKEAIDYYLKLSPTQKREMRNNNRNFYDNKCAINHFAQAYYGEINILVDEIEKKGITQ